MRVKDDEWVGRGVRTGSTVGAVVNMPGRDQGEREFETPALYTLRVVSGKGGGGEYGVKSTFFPQRFLLNAFSSTLFFSFPVFDYLPRLPPPTPSYAFVLYSPPPPSLVLFPPVQQFSQHHSTFFAIPHPTYPTYPTYPAYPAYPAQSTMFPHCRYRCYLHV